MKKAITLIALLSIINSAACSREGSGVPKSATGKTQVSVNDSGVGLRHLWTADGALKVPESVMYDAKRDRLYVSNIDGKPTDKDGKGFISIVSLEGKVITPEWVSGLNAPKGMAISGNYLYVTDIDRIVRIDIEKAAVANTYNVEGAKFLNDIAIDDRGLLYVSDMNGDCIYLLDKGKVSKWLDVPGPNGMLFSGGTLYVGCGPLYAINIGDKSRKEIAKNKGGIDGLKQYSDSAFIVSDWSGATNLLFLDGKVTQLLNTSGDNIQSADLEYITEKKLLLIPTFFGNSVTAYKVE